MFQTATEIFVYLIFAPSILLTGLFGNTIGFLVVQRPSLKNIGPRSTFCYLFFMDSFYLIQIITPYLLFGFSIDLTIVSSLTCKVYQYLNYSLDTQSAMLLVYISAERLVSIKYPTKKEFLRKQKTQLIYFFVVTIYNLLYYLPIAFYYDLQTYSIELPEHNNFTNKTIGIVCNFVDEKSQLILGYLDLVNRVLIPFILMVIFSSSLINYIFKSRQRAQANFTSYENKSFKRDLKFSITCIFLNSIYVAFNLPISITVFFPDYFLYITYPANLFLFYASYAVNFYILFFSNSLIRKEVLSLFKPSSSKYVNTVADVSCNAITK